MKYQIVDCFDTDKCVGVMFAANDRQEAVIGANDIGSGTLVVRRDEERLTEIIHRAGYQSDFGLSE